jgi:hypothetical protein
MIVDVPRAVTFAVLSGLLWRQANYIRTVNNEQRTAEAELRYKHSLLPFT